MIKIEYSISLKNVTKRFGDTVVVNNIDFQVEKGETIGIIGSNGSGKTTILRLIMGLIYPDKGEIRIRGEKLEPGFLGNLSTNIGALIENPLFLPHLTGIQNLKLLASIKNIISVEDIKKSMSSLGLDPDIKKTVDKYSMGMRQKLGLIQAIMENPDIILLDEPTNSLDTESIEKLFKKIDELKKRDTTFVIVSHRQDEIEILCDKIYTMNNGKLLISCN